MRSVFDKITSTWQKVEQFWASKIYNCFLFEIKKETKIFYEGDYVGNLTSASFGWTVGSSIGMGYVERKENKKLTKKTCVLTNAWTLEVEGDDEPITVQLAPLVSPKEKVQGVYSQQ